MAMPAVNLNGKKFGYLTVICRNGSTSGKTKCARWDCLCDCGSRVTRTSQYLRNPVRAHPRSCGCHHGNETHKMSDSRLFSVWSGMRRRCSNPHDKDWKNYGGRGITVCHAWDQSFQAFWDDMHAGYQEHLTLDRVNNSLGYSRENCRWSTALEQGNNKRTNRLLQTPDGEMTLSQAATHYGLLDITLGARINRYGWSVEQALTTPVHGKKRSTT